MPAFVLLAAVGSTALAGAPVVTAFYWAGCLLSARLNANWRIEKHRKKMKLYAALERQCVPATPITDFRQHFIWRSQRHGLPR